jgi:hypothetical protein
VLKVTYGLRVICFIQLLVVRPLAAQLNNGALAWQGSNYGLFISAVAVE